MWRIGTGNRWCAESGKPSRYLIQKKLNDVRQWYSTYDKKFYAVVQALRYWRHYLLPREFVLYLKYEALKYLNSQKRLNAKHSKWVEFLHDYTFVLKYKTGVENKVADTLSRCVMILITMSAEVIGFERLKEYNSCPDFGKIYVTLRDGSVREMSEFLLQDSYLFRFHKLCIPYTSLRNFLS